MPCLLALVLCHVWGDVSIAFAQGKTEDEGLEAFAQFLSIVVKIFVFLSLKLLEVGGKVMGTDYITGTEPMEAIRPMWVIIRNLTNIGFVMVLLFLAFGNLFSFGENGNWQIKDKLPKVIISLVVINFSLLGFRVVIDAVNVGMVSILSIADTVKEDNTAINLETVFSEKYDEMGSPCTSGTSCKPYGEWINAVLCQEEGSNCFAKFDDTKIESGDSEVNNILLAFVVHFQGLKDLVLLAGKTDSGMQVFEQTIFSSVLAIAYIAALIAVFIAMLARIVVLWIALVFSPLIVAAWIMGFSDGKGSELSETVITHLIMPLKIAAAFTVCYVMMSAMMGMEVFQDHGALQAGASLSTLAQGSVGILWKIASIVVFWKAAFWAIEGSAAKGITDKIQTGTQELGKFAAETLSTRQVFPMGKGEKVSFNTLSKTLDSFQDARAQKQREDYRSYRANVLGHGNDPEVDTGSDTLATAITNSGNNTTKLLQAIKDSNHQSLVAMLKDPTRGTQKDTIIKDIFDGNENEFKTFMSKSFDQQKEILDKKASGYNISFNDWKESPLKDDPEENDPNQQTRFGEKTKYNIDVIKANDQTIKDGDIDGIIKVFEDAGITGEELKVEKEKDPDNWAEKFAEKLDEEAGTDDLWGGKDGVIQQALEKMAEEKTNEMNTSEITINSKNNELTWKIGEEGATKYDANNAASLLGKLKENKENLTEGQLKQAYDFLKKHNQKVGNKDLGGEKGEMIFKEFQEEINK
jgi:hypothetical protein